MQHFALILASAPNVQTDAVNVLSGTFSGLLIFTLVLATGASFFSITAARRATAASERSLRQVQDQLAQLSKGFAAEIQQARTLPAEIGESREAQDPGLIGSLQSLVRSAFLSANTSADFIQEVLSAISPVSLALITAIANVNSHLELGQYAVLLESPGTREAVKQLRANGLLVPLVHTHDGAESEVYYLPPMLAEIVAKVGRRFEIPDNIKKQVAQELRSIGYGRR